MGLRVAESDSRAEGTVSVKLKDEAAQVVRELARTRGLTIGDVLSNAIALEQFVVEKLEGGATFMLTSDGGKTFERVDFLI